MSAIIDQDKGTNTDGYSTRYWVWSIRILVLSSRCPSKKIRTDSLSIASLRTQVISLVRTKEESAGSVTLSKALELSRIKVITRLSWAEALPARAGCTVGAWAMQMWSAFPAKVTARTVGERVTKLKTAARASSWSAVLAAPTVVHAWFMATLGESQRSAGPCASSTRTNSK